MPQKRNPVALEHARAIGSKAVGQAQAIMTAVHNTPFGDIVDTEDDLQPLVASMFRDAMRMVTLVARRDEAGADFNVARLASRAGARRHHDHRAGRHAGPRSRPAVPHRARDRRAAAQGAAPRTRRVRCRARWRRRPPRAGAPLKYTEAELQKIMSPEHFVKVRTTLGGPAPSETARALGESRALLEADRAGWLTRGPTSRPPRRATARAGEDAVSRACAGNYMPRGGRVGRRARGAVRLPAVPSRGTPEPLSPSCAASTGPSSSSICLDRLGRAAPTKQSKELGGLLPRRPQPAVVGRRPVGDGHAAVGHHDDRHHRARATPTACASCSSTTRCRSR